MDTKLTSDHTYPEVAQVKPFEHYVKSGMAVKEARNITRAKDLIKNAPVKLDIATSRELTPETAPFRLMGAYEAMSDCVAGLMALDGYRTDSKEVMVSYIIDLYRSYYGEKLAMSYAQCTGLRNDIVNRAISVTVGQAEEAIKTAREFVRISQDILSAKLTIMV